jgi:hypothetical protein
VAVALEPAGLAVVDLDRHKPGVDGLVSLRQLEAEHGRLEGPIVATPSDGLHIYSATPGGMAPARRIGVRPGLDVLSAGYVVVPPTERPDGAYRWMQTMAEAGLPELPSWLAALAARPTRQRRDVMDVVSVDRIGKLSRYARAAIAGELVRVASAPAGRRHTVTYSAAATLAGLAAGLTAQGLPAPAEDEIVTLLLLGADESGLTDDDGEAAVVRAILDGWRRGWTDPRELRGRGRGAARRRAA